MSTFIQTVWTKNEAHVAHSIVIKANTHEIEWVKYEIPVTSHSGGSAETYAMDEMQKNSSLYYCIAKDFGNEVANEILESIKLIKK